MLRILIYDIYIAVSVWLVITAWGVFVCLFFFLVLSSCFQYGFREIPVEYIQAKFGVTRNIWFIYV